MKLSQAISAVNAAIDADIPVMLWGAPGIGKSETVASVADARGAAFYDIRLNLFDPVDLRGLPAMVDGRTVWLKPGIWPEDESRETVLLFDEIDRAAPAVMSAAMQIVLDRRVGEHVLPASVRIVAAGNGKTDRAGTNRMPAALANRLCHIEIEPDVESWAAWAVQAGIDPILVAFMRFRPALLHVMEGGDARSFPSPRAWSAANRVMAQPDDIRFALIAGLVGAPAAAEFEAFARVVSTLPSFADIVANPGLALVPSDPGACYALASGLARHATPANFGAVLEYARRMPREFEIVTATDAVRRDKALTETAAFVAFATRNQDVTL